MQYFSRSLRPKTIPYPESKKLQPTFSIEIDKETGKKEIKQTGQTNLYEKIQAAKEETLIYNILERYQNGDIEALNKAQGIYNQDFRNAPKTLAEAQQIIINAEKTFNELPLDIRREFNMSSSEFLAAAANGKLQEVIKKLDKSSGQPFESTQPAQEQPQAQPTQQPEQGGIRYE